MATRVFHAGVASQAGVFGTDAESAADSLVSWLVSLLLPSPIALVWLLTGFAAGVALGCFGATALRPCAALHALPVVLAVAALYAVAYLS